jgi:hypothetical protein
MTPNPRFFKLRNGATFDLNDLQLILRGKMINEYHFVLRNAAAAPQGDADDVKAVEVCINIIGETPKLEDKPLVAKLDTPFE